MFFKTAMSTFAKKLENPPVLVQLGTFGGLGLMTSLACSSEAEKAKSGQYEEKLVYVPGANVWLKTRSPVPAQQETSTPPTLKQ